VVVTVTGHLCERGERYAIDEYTAPRRVLTTTINLQNASTRYLPVKTSQPIPKELLFPCMAVLQRVVVSPPIALGDVVVTNVLGTGVDVVATRSVRRDDVTTGRS
jgi:CxxC motif-containing protein